MSFALVILYSILIPPTMQCEPLTLEEAIAESDVIFVGKILSKSSMSSKALIEISIEEQLAGDNAEFNLTIIREDTSACSIDFKIGSSYLIFGQKLNRYQISTDHTFRSNLLVDSSKDLNLLMQQTNCWNLENFEKTGCFKVSKPVCGCNGKTYSNSCYARNAGIHRWKLGSCQ